METILDDGDNFGRWRRFWTMETIFPLNETSIRLQKYNTKCLVKPKKRLRRPKSSPSTEIVSNVKTSSTTKPSLSFCTPSDILRHRKENAQNLLILVSDLFQPACIDRVVFIANPERCGVFILVVRFFLFFVETFRTALKAIKVRVVV